MADIMVVASLEIAAADFVAAVADSVAAGSMAAAAVASTVVVAAATGDSKVRNPKSESAKVEMKPAPLSTIVFL